MRRTAMVIVALAALTAACGNTANQAASDAGSEDRTDRSAPSTTTATSQKELPRPPDLQVHADGTVVSLRPYSYCWVTNGDWLCADGPPQEPLPTVNLDSDSELSVTFPLDWHLTANLLTDGMYCNGVMVADADPQGSPLQSLGPAGTYRVEVFGRGDGGDAAWAFELVTTEDRPSPAPFWQVFWFPSERDLEIDATFGASVGNIAIRPTEVSATAVVTASNGASAELDLSVGDDRGCWGSSIGFESDTDFTARVVDLGPPPTVPQRTPGVHQTHTRLPPYPHVRVRLVEYSVWCHTGKRASACCRLPHILSTRSSGRFRWEWISGLGGGRRRR